LKAVLQRVSNASVAVDGKICGEIKQGLLVLLGVSCGDDEKTADFLADKCSKLRIFCDENDKMNLSLLDIEGEMLVISNFTLYADSRKGKRPSYTEAARPDEANRLYEHFISSVKKIGVKKVESGVFGADMKVSLLNDGPVTIILDTDIIMAK